MYSCCFFSCSRNFSLILFRIYHRGDLFSLQNPPIQGFPLVSSLISFYQEQATLSGVGSSSQTGMITPHLVHPVSRFQYRFQIGRTPEIARSLSAADLDTPQLLNTLKNRFMEVAKCKSKIDKLNVDSSIYLQSMRTQSNLLRGLTKTNDWLQTSNTRFNQNARIKSQPNPAM